MNHICKIREKLGKRELCFGTHCSATDADFYEMCGLAGYDYIWIDNEHGGMTQPMIKNAIVATNAGGCAAFVRVPDHEVGHVKPVLECGPDGIIFPMVNTPEQAKHCVEICTYPPRGIRGFGPLRAIDYCFTSIDDYIKTADSSFFRIMQCESLQAVKNLDAILDVPGIDAIICGPMDLSFSVNKPGRFFDPLVLELMDTIIEKCKAHSMPFGLSIGVGLDLVMRWMEKGANFLSVGTPLDYFREMSRDVVRQVRDFEAKSGAYAR